MSRKLEDVNLDGTLTYFIDSHPRSLVYHIENYNFFFLAKRLTLTIINQDRSLHYDSAGLFYFRERVWILIDEYGVNVDMNINYSPSFSSPAKPQRPTSYLFVEVI